MNKANFDKLLNSMQEARDALNGKTQPSRKWIVEKDKRFMVKEDVQAIRHEFGLSQSVFAKFMGVSVNTLQNWEQGRRQPTGAARVLLTLAMRQPKLFREVMEEDCPEMA